MIGKWRHFVAKDGFNILGNVLNEFDDSIQIDDNGQNIIISDNEVFRNHCSMFAGGVAGDLVMGKSFGYSNLATMAIDFEAQMMGYVGVIKFNDGSAFEYKTVQDFSKVSLTANNWQN